MAKKKPRSSSARGLRRKLARLVKKDEARHSSTLAQLPGGDPERPIEVASAAVIEPRATRDSCLRCGGPVDVAEHVARVIAERRLREVTVRCRACGASRRIYMALPESVLH